MIKSIIVCPFLVLSRSALQAVGFPGVAGLANFSPRVSGFLCLNREGFQILRHVTGCGLCHSVFGFRVFHSKNTVHGVGERENAGNDRRLLTKIEDFCSEVLSRVLAFFLRHFKFLLIFLVNQKIQPFDWYPGYQTLSLKGN